MGAIRSKSHPWVSYVGSVMAAAFGYLSGVGGAGWIERVGVSMCLETAGLRRPPRQGQPSLLAAKTGGPEAQRQGQHVLGGQPSP